MVEIGYKMLTLETPSITIKCIICVFLMCNM